MIGDQCVNRFYKRGLAIQRGPKHKYKSDQKIAMVMEELYDIVDSIADLTVEDVKRHLSNRCQSFSMTPRSSKESGFLHKSANGCFLASLAAAEETQRKTLSLLARTFPMATIVGNISTSERRRVEIASLQNEAQ